MNITKKVLFVCVENSARSQMAEGFLRELAPHVDAQSAGTRPCAEIDPVAVRVMREVGIDITGQSPKLVTDVMIRDSLTVGMGCMDKQDACPALLMGNVDDWQIEDPKNKDIEQVRRIRDQIRERVQELLAKIDGQQ